MIRTLQHSQPSKIKKAPKRTESAKYEEKEEMSPVVNIDTLRS